MSDTETAAPAGEPESTPAAPSPSESAGAGAIAVLTDPRGELLVGQLVTASEAAIGELITAGKARAATAGEVIAADTFIHALPGA